MILLLVIFFSSGMNKVASDLTIAYSDTELYNNALEKVKANESALNILGEIQPIDKLAILEGQANYSEDNSSVKTSIRIVGTKGNAKLDIIANKVKNDWVYKTINIRIKKPKDKKQTIVIVSEN
ncbi:cytochrome c oxidase assembly factor Coa1 family protein [Psychroserpens ponticola]|uniref:Cytochrome c oxidase assembly factor Coa1 family protein n=1 Tax=Psychroserpens ponticola TaxID=2932268 RepID=A0ABY7RTQ1_9FLAO|nr:cytochrome c oxidase assembly factor Coa1 family protein [Psychroserpens ponticola]WCO00494.1 cytochrome c oxidase assembly factor Coa1 family protein [Psychroserpens ponticola]